MDEDDDDDDQAPMPPEEILELAYDVVAEMQDNGIAPGTTVKILTTAICLVIQNATFRMTKPEVAAEITQLISKYAATSQAEDDEEQKAQQ